MSRMRERMARINREKDISSVMKRRNEIDTGDTIISSGISDNKIVISDDKTEIMTNSVDGSAKFSKNQVAFQPASSFTIGDTHRNFSFSGGAQAFDWGADSDTMSVINPKTIIRDSFGFEIAAKFKGLVAPIKNLVSILGGA